MAWRLDPAELVARNMAIEKLAFGRYQPVNTQNIVGNIRSGFWIVHTNLHKTQ